VSVVCSPATAEVLLREPGLAAPTDQETVGNLTFLHWR
jgi:hypothetical protein